MLRPTFIPKFHIDWYKRFHEHKQDIRLETELCFLAFDCPVLIYYSLLCNTKCTDVILNCSVNECAH